MENELSTQTGHEACWMEGRLVDMAAFDQLPPQLRAYLNKRQSFFPVEDVLWEHVNAHNGDWELTMVWLLECDEITIH